MEGLHKAAGEAVPAVTLMRTRKGGERIKTAEEFIDSLTDYICTHVTSSLKPVQDVIEKKIIINALRRAGGSQKEAARILGIKYTTLNYKVKKHRIRVKKNPFIYSG